MTSTFAIAQLRHLYQQLHAGTVLDQRGIATGLLGPAIEALETEAGLTERLTRSEAATIREAIELIDRYAKDEAGRRACVVAELRDILAGKVEPEACDVCGKETEVTRKCAACDVCAPCEDNS
jgi:hypothetical protein